MLEKIGLPAKPSLRGNNWVVDGSHCQACSTQFTFINRKHHCRRCGGLFCNSCTQQRMVLRGQGDAPVRICEPCKKIEEAARFERRYGHKSKAGRGDAKLDSHNGDPALNQILDDIASESLLSRRESTISNFQRASSSASCSKTEEASTKGEDLLQVLSGDEPNHLASETGSATPDELRQQALAEKNKYKLLKGEGKPAEALKAFKRGKELEREAAAMEIYLRKSRKKTFSTSNTMEVLKVKDDPKYSDKKTNRSSQMGKDKDDLTAELKELGWSDIDASKKPANMSLEGELFTLVGESSQNTSNGTRVIDKSEVISLKKKALTLKREGKLAEAKEELKRAKILEKQLEEQEFLGEAEDSDDELSLLIRSMDDDKQDDLLHTKMPDSDFDFNHLMVIPGDLDATFEVTDGDMDDPEIAAALNSLGWTEDSKPLEDNNIVPQVVPIDREALLSEILSLKKEALNKKRAGNTADALTLLKKAKLLERDLENHDSHENTMLLDVPALTQDGILGKVDKMEVVEPPRIASKSKIMIQRELLGLKKKALTLKREGRLDEAEEELKKAKVFEQQLEDIDNNVSKGKIKPGNIIETHSDNISIPMDLEGGEDEDINDQDLHDPSYLSVLKNLGWKDEDNDVVSVPSKPVKQSEIIAAKLTDSASTKTQTSSNIRVGGSKRSKGELQRELLGLKRKALALRRQGQTEEAEEVLNTAKELEDQIAEMEAPKNNPPVEPVKHHEIETIQSNSEISLGHVIEKIQEEDIKTPPSVTSPSKSLVLDVIEKIQEEDIKTPPSVISPSKTLVLDTDTTSVEQKEQTSSSLPSKPLSGRDRFKLQQKSLGHKRASLKLRREGRIEEAEAEFKLAKDLEAQLEESAVNTSVTGAEPVDNVGVEGLLDPQLLSALKAIGIEGGNVVSGGSEKPETKQVSVDVPEKSSQERIQLSEEIKAEKIKAVNLKRSGNKAEALDALRRAKVLEKKLVLLDS